MKDQIDRANELAEKEREFALAKYRQKQTACVSLTDCEDCDEPIPEERRRFVVGCTRCIDCQQDHEHRLKGYRK
ncbi:molecular chaperone DnaK [Pasteurellaceae bacterium LFhippo2]|nr:molecular chaperone DnaK [Pasteurellaceae bacterium LFhippo2]